MARRGSPALYELMGSSRGKTSTPTVSTRRIGSAKPARAPIDRAKLRLLGFIGGALVLVVAVYLLGVSRGSQTASQTGRGDADVAEATGAQQAAQAPTNQTAAPRGASAQPGAGTRVAGQSENKQPAPTPQSGTPAGQAPRANVDSGAGSALPPAQRGVDPRQAGLQYYVIASVLEGNADKVVAFCREHGLDAWVVPDHNGRLREITVLPGFSKSETKGPVAKALEARIRKVGELFKAAGKNNPDFEDRYFKAFNG